MQNKGEKNSLILEYSKKWVWLDPHLWVASIVIAILDSGPAVTPGFQRIPLPPLFHRGGVVLCKRRLVQSFMPITCRPGVCLWDPMPSLLEYGRFLTHNSSGLTRRHGRGVFHTTKGNRAYSRGGRGSSATKMTVQITKNMNFYSFLRSFQ